MYDQIVAATAAGLGWGRKASWRNNMFRKHDDTVSIGDYFVSTGRMPATWVVELVYIDPSNVRHARLRRADNPTVLRTFSCAVLVNGAQFRRLARGAPA